MSGSPCVPRGWRRAAFLIALAVLVGPLGSLPSEAEDTRRVVAIGDIHGAYEEFRSILLEVGLIDEENRWIGGDSVLVQTGDFLDRGRYVRQVMDLLMSLQEQAPVSGGEVKVLLGNHEAMNLLGFARDVNPEVYEDFADAQSTDRVKRSYESYRRWYRGHRRFGHVEETPYSAEDFERAFPLGFLEHQEALGPRGQYGVWLRSLPAAVEIDGTVFLHGGISPALVGRQLVGISLQIKEELERFDECRLRLLRDHIVHETADPVDIAREGLAQIAELRRRAGDLPAAVRKDRAESLRVLSRCAGYGEWFLINEDGPLWFRGLATSNDEGGAPVVGEALRELAARRFVVGHTPQRDGKIRTRFDGRAVLIDTGMLSAVYRGGRPSALVLEGGRVTARYLDGEQESLQSLADGTAITRRYRGPDGKVLPFNTDDDVRSFLMQARVVETKRLEVGTTQPFKVLLELDGVRAYAVFRSHAEHRMNFKLSDGRMFRQFEDNYRFEPAAYEVSQMLAWPRIPPVVMREVEGKGGSLQLWLHGVFDEAARDRERREPPNTMDWLQQRAVRFVFDALISNFDRNQGNILIDEQSWMVWWIDHTRSFRQEDELEKEALIVQCDRLFLQRLIALQRADVEARLSPFLTGPEIEALLRRRDLVVALIKKRIAERGEAAVLFDYGRRDSL